MKPSSRGIGVQYIAEHVAIGERRGAIHGAQVCVRTEESGGEGEVREGRPVTVHRGGERGRSAEGSLDLDRVRV